nr:MAG TPA: hypothetical protein [Caudoviricetes sp.]
MKRLQFLTYYFIVSTKYLTIKWRRSASLSKWQK